MFHIKFNQKFKYSLSFNKRMKHSNILAILHFKIMIIVQCKLQFFDSNIILHYGWSALLCRVYLGFYLVNLSNILDFGVGLFHFLFFDKWSWSVSFPPIFSLTWSGTYMLQWFWVASCSIVRTWLLSPLHHKWQTWDYLHSTLVQSSDRAFLFSSETCTHVQTILDSFGH